MNEKNESSGPDKGQVNPAKTSRAPQVPAKPEVPYREFTDPSRAALGLPATARIYEPHDYNRKLLESQRARGVAANIPQVPMAKTHKIAIKKPAQLDLVAKAKAIHAAMRASQEMLAAGELNGGADVLPDDSIQFEELG